MLKNEGTSYQVMIHAPKDYSGFDEKGESWLKAKGVPKFVKSELPPTDHPKYAAKRAGPDEFIAAHRGGGRLPFGFPSPTTFNTYMRTGKFVVHRTRRQTAPENIYGHRIDSGGMFRPLHIAEDEPCLILPPS